MKAAGAYPTITAAQDALCLPYKVIEPQPEEAERAEKLFQLYCDMYQSMGLPDAPAKPLGHVLPQLKRLREQALSQPCGPEKQLTP
jgi:L-ribulokinase